MNAQNFNLFIAFDNASANEYIMNDKKQWKKLTNVLSSIITNPIRILQRSLMPPICNHLSSPVFYNESSYNNYYEVYELEYTNKINQ